VCGCGTICLGLLEDPGLLALSTQVLAGRSHGSSKSGREGIAPDRLLRCVVLKHIKGRSYRQRAGAWKSLACHSMAAANPKSSRTPGRSSAEMWRTVCSVSSSVCFIRFAISIVARKVFPAVLVQKLETGGWPRYRRRMADLPSAQELFKNRHFDREIIILCVRWYLNFKLSSRDLVQMMAERARATSDYPTFIRSPRQSCRPLRAHGSELPGPNCIYMTNIGVAR
jgi:hypothetical protein